MLDEYLCLGGNEVANNARAYGYATTAGCPLGWFRLQPCESLHDAINPWIPAQYRWIETRRNLWTNPRAVNGGTAFGSVVDGSASYITSFPGDITTARRFTSSVPSGTARPLALPIGTSFPSAGEFLNIRMEIRTSVALSNVSIHARPDVTSGTGTVLIQNIGSLAIGTHVIDVTGQTFTGTAGASAGIAVIAAIPGVGSTVDFTKILVEVLNNASTSYFDGSTVSPDPDIQYRWLGTTNSSVSVAEAWTLITPGASAEPPYINTFIDRAPWYDAQRDELTRRFYGVYLIEVQGVDDSTLSATVSQSILDGAVAGLARNEGRMIRVRALLSAEGEDALSYGKSWLDSALSSEGCSQHGGACGAVDMAFFDSCPPPSQPSDEVYDPIEQNRYLHNVSITSGAIVTERYKSSNGVHVGWVVEWEMVAGTPWVFGETQEISLSPSVPVLIQDVPYNLIAYPSAELATGSVIAATNYSTNPSVETNATGWASGSAAISGTNPSTFVTSGRSTDIHAGDGVASFRVRLLGNNGSTSVTNAVADIYGENAFSITPGTGQRYSVTVWGAAFIIAGASGSALTSLTASIIWRNGGSTLRTDTIGTATTGLNGTVFSMKSIVPPASTNAATIRVTARVTWSSSATPANNSDIHLFVDTVALTTP